MMARHWAPKVATRPMLYWPNSPPSTRTGDRLSDTAKEVVAV
ncbi:Uncharacterised protein [Bordetella pertussis]|nr:Uncharacterised protein [Bordetella pertussis]